MEEAAILNRVLDRDWTLNRRGPLSPWNCPVCSADMLSNLCGIAHKWGWEVPDVPGLTPKLFLGHFYQIPLFQARKRSTNSNFWTRISSSSVGVFQVKGFGMSLGTRATKLFWWDILGFHLLPGYLGGPRKVLERKSVFNFWPLLLCLCLSFLLRDGSQEYPQYCWEFHDQLWEALSGTNSEKRGVPSLLGGREFWKRSGSLQCLEL